MISGRQRKCSRSMMTPGKRIFERSYRLVLMSSSSAWGRSLMCCLISSCTEASSVPTACGLICLSSPTTTALRAMPSAARPNRSHCELSSTITTSNIAAAGSKDSTTR